MISMYFKVNLKFVFLVFCLLIGVTHIPLGVVSKVRDTNDNEAVEKNLNPTALEYQPHSAIFIDDNNDFVTLGFIGSGTENDPYLIEGYEITGSSPNLINIQNTDVYFEISNNVVNGLNQASAGILLNSVMNGMIFNNFISGLQEFGISLESSQNVIILNNTIFQNIHELGPGSGGVGIALSNSDNNYITSNSIYENSGEGMWFSSSSRNLIDYNVVNNNDIDGILVLNIDGSSNYPSENVFEYNAIYDNDGVGIRIGYGISLDSTIQFNVLTNNVAHNILLTEDSNSITIVNNDFTVAQQFGPQAIDNGTSNSFSNNYWSNWVSPDIDENGIVDDPFLIDGLAGNSDPTPRVDPNDPDLTYRSDDIMKVLVLDRQQSIGGLDYNQVIESEYNDNYLAYGNTQIIIDTTNLSSQTITSELLTQSQADVIYLHNMVRVLSMDEQSALTAYVSSGHGIIGTHYTLTETHAPLAPLFGINPNLISNGDAIAYPLNSTMTFDNPSHPLLAKISSPYVVDRTFSGHINGQPNPWTNDPSMLLENGTLLATSMDGDIAIIYSQGEDFRSVYLTHNPAASVSPNDLQLLYNSLSWSSGVSNQLPHITPSVILQPNSGEERLGVVSVEWTAASDSYFHSMSYSVLFSKVGSNTWNLLASDYAVTSYLWDTRTVQDGDYVLKIVQSDSEGFEVETVMEGPFKIINSKENDSKTPTIPFTNFSIILLGLIIPVILKKRSKL